MQPQKSSLVRPRKRPAFLCGHAWIVRFLFSELDTFLHAMFDDSHSDINGIVRRVPFYDCGLNLMNNAIAEFDDLIEFSMQLLGQMQTHRW